MGNIITHPSKNTSLTKFIKAHVYHPWQNYSFCKDDQAQRSSTTKPSWTSPAHTEIPATKAHVSCQVKLQYNLTAGAHCHQFQLVQSDQKRTRVQQGLNPSLPSWIPSFLMWHEAGMTWHKAGKLQPTVFSFFSNPFGQGLRATITRPWKLLEQLKISSLSCEKHVLPGTWTKHMNPKWGNLGKCGLEGTKGISNRVPNKGIQDWHLAWSDAICPREHWF